MDTTPAIGEIIGTFLGITHRVQTTADGGVRVTFDLTSATMESEMIKALVEMAINPRVVYVSIIEAKK